MTDTTAQRDEAGTSEPASSAPPTRRPAQRLLAQLSMAINAGAGVDDIVGIVSALRLSGDQATRDELDRYLVNRVCEFVRATGELEAVHVELREQLQALLNPPFFPARYLGSVRTGAGEFATVLNGGALRVVAFATTVSPADLAVGDEVYLCHERNAVIEKASHRRAATGETAALIRQVDDSRLLIADRDAEVVVAVGDDLSPESLRPGDTLLWDRAAHIALGRLESGKSCGYEDIDDAQPPLLGGMDFLRDEALAKFILPITSPELAEDYAVVHEGSNRILLHGPPGTGKTTLMRTIAARIARETNRHCRVVTVSGAELYSSYVGETERNIRRCFALLRDHDGPGIVFFDEIDAIGRVRGHAAGFHDDRFLGTLLAEMEGMRRTNVAVIGATNRADTLDPALRGRFAEEIEMPRPNVSAARQIFAVHLPEDIPYRPNSGESPQTRLELIEAGVAHLYDPNADTTIASLTFRDGKRREIAARELVSGRLIEQICTAARAKAFSRHCRGGAAGVSLADMRSAAGEAIERLRATLSRQNVASYLPDLPQDAAVVAVEPHRPRVPTARYSRSQ